MCRVTELSLPFCLFAKSLYFLGQGSSPKPFESGPELSWKRKSSCVTERHGLWACLISTGIMEEVWRSSRQKGRGGAQVGQPAWGRSRITCTRKGFWQVLMDSCPPIRGQPRIHHCTSDPSPRVMVLHRFSVGVNRSREPSSRAWCNLV